MNRFTTRLLVLAVAGLAFAAPALAKTPIVIIEKGATPILIIEKKSTPIIIFEKVVKAFTNPIIIIERRR